MSREKKGGKKNSNKKKEYQSAKTKRNTCALTTHVLVVSVSANYGAGVETRAFPGRGLRLGGVGRFPRHRGERVARGQVPLRKGALPHQLDLGLLGLDVEHLGRRDGLRQLEGVAGAELTVEGGIGHGDGGVSGGPEADRLAQLLPETFLVRLFGGWKGRNGKKMLQNRNTNGREVRKIKKSNKARGKNIQTVRDTEANAERRFLPFILRVPNCSTNLRKLLVPFHTVPVKNVAHESGQN